MFTGDYYLRSFNNNYFIIYSSSRDFENTNNGIVYFGRSSCPECESIEPIISDIAREERIKIFYFDTEYIKNEENIDSGILQEYLLQYQVESVPAVIGIRKGLVIENLSDLLSGGAIKSKLLNALMPYRDLD